MTGTDELMEFFSEKAGLGTTAGCLSKPSPDGWGVPVCADFTVSNWGMHVLLPR